MHKGIKYLVCLGLVLLSTAALAQKRNPLKGQPAVRHRYELRDGRFEIGPTFMFSLNRAMRQAFLIGVKAEYHFHDYFSAGFDMGFGINFNTDLLSRLDDEYTMDGNKYDRWLKAHDDWLNSKPASPTLKQLQDWQQKEPKRVLTGEEIRALKHWRATKDDISDIKFAGDLRFTFTPLYGRLAIFSKAFLLYDLYIFTGVALAYTSNPNQNSAAASKLTNEGFRAGWAVGLGMHVFVNHWISIGFEVKNLMFMDNETGQDQTRGYSDSELNKYNELRKTNPSDMDRNAYVLVDEADQTFKDHWFAGLNLTFFIPTLPAISR